MRTNHKIPPNHRHYYNNEFWYSKAYQSLTITARELLHSLICELRWSGRGKKKVYTNNGSVSFTEVQFRERYGCCSATYLKARNQLIDRGLIEQTERGGMCRGDRAKYRILCVDGISLNRQKWREYPDKNCADKIPKRKNQLVGKSTQWMKGQCGRNSKATLLKCTHNNVNDPIKVNPKK